MRVRNQVSVTNYKGTCNLDPLRSIMDWFEAYVKTRGKGGFLDHSIPFDHVNIKLNLHRTEDGEIKLTGEMNL